MEETLIYTGYRSFVSKKDKRCNVLDFITLPKSSEDKSRVYVTPASIFVDDDVYSDFINNTKLLSQVKCKVNIVGNYVRYSLA